MKKINGSAHKVVALAKEKWTSSGLGDAVAKRLQLTPVPDASTLASNFLKLPALQIPYFTMRGAKSKFFRVRYLALPSGMAGLVEKPQRYAQPVGSLNEVYCPPLFGTSWENIAKDSEKEIIITEGELKAASACNIGLPCIGLGGVDVWRSGSRGIDFLPHMEAIEWKARRVYIAFDSDAATNVNVVRAQLRLSKELLARGAYVFVVSIPAAHTGEKQGLDDFIVNAGDDAVEKWQSLTAESKLVDEAGELWKFNTELAYIRDPGLIVVRKDGLKMSSRALVDHAYSNRHYTERTYNAKGEEKITKKAVAPHWLAWEQRYELARITYKPGAPDVTERGEYNEWKGWGCDPKRGDIAPWRDLLDYMFKGKAAERQWFERWCAYPLQHPGVKMFSSALIWGATQGTGKTLIGYTLMKIYGDEAPRENSREIKNKDLESGDNDWAQNKQFIVGDEISSHDKRKDSSDYVKSIITREKVTINIKYVPKYTVPDHINYYFTSQHPDAMFVEDTDRRFFIHQAPGIPLSRDFYNKYDAWRKGLGPQALFHHLLNLDTGDFDPAAHAMQTDAKRAMIMDSKSELGAWVAQLREDPVGTLQVLGSRASAEACLLTSEQLRRCYDPEHATKVTAIGIGKEMKRSGFVSVNGGQPVMTTLGAQRLYIVRQTERWQKAKLTECAKHWSDLFGPASSKVGPKKGRKKK